MYLGKYFGFSAGFGFLALLAYAILQWLHIPVGSLVDWLIGIASFWWLLAIVTVPWNVYFDAQEVITEAEFSKKNNIAIDTQQLQYVKRVLRWSLVLAIALHILSAIGLYSLAASGISAVGYISSGATLLLTALRPAIRAYQYIASRLFMIKEQIKYPREDIYELRNRVSSLEYQLQEVQYQLDGEKTDSFKTIQQKDTKNIRKDLAQLRASLEQLEAKNKLEHEGLSREANNAIAQLTEDSQVLSHVREIIRFFKQV